MILVGIFWGITDLGWVDVQIKHSQRKCSWVSSSVVKMTTR